MQLIINNQRNYPDVQTTGGCDTDPYPKVNSREYVVYIGDSLPDLSCLSSADIGICIWQDDESSSLRQFMDRACLNLRHISMYREPEEHKDHDKEMFWARDFDEVVESGIWGSVLGDYSPNQSN